MRRTPPCKRRPRAACLCAKPAHNEAMHLIKHDIEHCGVTVVALFCESAGITVAELDGGLPNLNALRARLPDASRPFLADAVDFYAALRIAHTAQTFVFDAKQVMEFLRAVDRKLPPGNYAAPFSEMIFQFSQPIPEREFLTGFSPSAEMRVEDDDLLGLIIGFPPDEDCGQIVNIIAFYRSLAINRAVLTIGGDGTVPSEYMIGGPSPDGLRDKQRIANLAMLCLAYLNSPGIEVEKVATPEKVNRKRRREGKRVLEDYYVCRLAKGRSRASDGEPTGRHMAFRFDVAGYFRRAPDGRVVWVRAHQRGLKNELYRPKVYRVD